MHQSGSIPPGVLAAQSDSWSNQPVSGASGSSWQTPNTSYASVTVPPARKRNPAWLVLAGAALVLGGIGIGAVVSKRPRVDGTTASAPPRTNDLPPPATSEVESPRSPESETPTVSVESLPGAARTQAVPKGAGRLSLASSPGSCAIVIDGKEQGSTPLASLDLPAGPHEIQCKPPVGKPRTASVVVQDGATSKYRFALDD